MKLKFLKGFVFIFLEIENFKKNKNKPLFSRRSVCYQVSG
jgi:hypothetical protein